MFFVFFIEQAQNVVFILRNCLQHEGFLMVFDRDIFTSHIVLRFFSILVRWFLNVMEVTRVSLFSFAQSLLSLSCYDTAHLIELIRSLNIPLLFWTFSYCVWDIPVLSDFFLLIQIELSGVAVNVHKNIPVSPYEVSSEMLKQPRLLGVKHLVLVFAINQKRVF